MNFNLGPLTLDEYISYMKSELDKFRIQAVEYQTDGTLPESLEVQDWDEQFDFFHSGEE